MANREHRREITAGAAVQTPGARRLDTEQLAEKVGFETALRLLGSLTLKSVLGLGSAHRFGRLPGYERAFHRNPHPRLVP
jgi:hypothetical protein